MKNLLLLVCIALLSSCYSNDESTRFEKEVSELPVQQKIARAEFVNTAGEVTISQSVHTFDNMHYAIISIEDADIQVINLTKDSLEIALLKKQLSEQP